MSGCPGFAVLLARLLDHRNLGLADVSGLAGIPGPELQAVLGGVAPNPSLLRRLAPALGLHTADLFVLAWAPVPDELTPLDPRVGERVPSLVWNAVRLPKEARIQLWNLAQSMPQGDRPHPPVPLPPEERHETGFGGVVVRLLANRNLKWIPAAKTLHLLASQTMSGSTVARIGYGYKELTLPLAAGFATVLGIAVGDLISMGGFDMPAAVPPPHPAASDIADLIWDVRRLTLDQMEQVIAKAAFLLAA